MPRVIHLTARLLFAIALCLCATSFAYSQSFYFRYRFAFEPGVATRAPELGGLNIKFPDAARKHQVEGVAKFSMTLGNDGRVREVKVLQDLPHGVSEAVVAALETYRFTPAAAAGKPVDVSAVLEYVVQIAYDEGDKSVVPVKILEQPQAVYPPTFAAKRIAGKVTLLVLFYPSGEAKLLAVESVMPRDFDEAAKNAAKLLKFEPASHRVTKQPVAQSIRVFYDFK
jgi:outer membrane biosynthesis protein TonB